MGGESGKTVRRLGVQRGRRGGDQQNEDLTNKSQLGGDRREKRGRSKK